MLSILQEQASNKQRIPTAAHPIRFHAHPVCFHAHPVRFHAHPVHFHPHPSLLSASSTHNNYLGKNCVILPHVQVRLAMGLGRSQMSPSRLTLRAAGPRCAQDSLYLNNCSMQSTAAPLDKTNDCLSYFYCQTNQK